MNKYEKIMQKVKKLGVQVKKTGVPVLSAVQIKPRLHSWQIDMLDSFKSVKKTHFILTLSKNRPVGEITSIRISYNGKRLIPLK